MEINKIGSINKTHPVNEQNKTNSVASTPPTSSKDSVHFSEDSKIQSLHKKVMDIIKEVPDIRIDKVKEAQQLLESFNNPTDETLEIVSKKILNEFGIE